MKHEFIIEENSLMKKVINTNYAVGRYVRFGSKVAARLVTAGMGGKRILSMDRIDQAFMWKRDL